MLLETPYFSHSIITERPMVGKHQTQQKSVAKKILKTFLPKKDWAHGKKREDSKKQILQQLKNVAKWNWYSQHLLLENSDIFHSLVSNYKLQNNAVSYTGYKKRSWDWLLRDIKNEKIFP